MYSDIYSVYISIYLYLCTGYKHIEMDYALIRLDLLICMHIWMLIASQFGKTLGLCFRVAPELHGEAIFAISGDQTPRLGHIDVVVSGIYIYIYRYPRFFWRSFAYMFDMGNSSTANRRSYFKMRQLIETTVGEGELCRSDERNQAAHPSSSQSYKTWIRPFFGCGA